MGFLEDLANFLVKNISKTIRHFSAFVFVIMTIGVAVGSHVAITRPDSVTIAILTPLLLAMLSYYSTVIAALFFVVFVLIMFVLL